MNQPNYENFKSYPYETGQKYTHIEQSSFISSAITRDSNLNKLNLAQKYINSFKPNNKEGIVQVAKRSEGKISIKAYKKSFANVFGFNHLQEQSQPNQSLSVSLQDLTEEKPSTQIYQ